MYTGTFPCQLSGGLGSGGSVQFLLDFEPRETVTANAIGGRMALESQPQM